MSGLTFVHREAVHLIWGVVLLIGWLGWLELGQRDLLARFIGPPMQVRLARRLPPTRRGLRLGLLLLGMVCIVLALMRPQSLGEVESMAAGEVSADVMVVLDVSRSMLAEDAAPSRLERAKAEVADLVGRLQGQRVGLTAFAGRAQVLCPLTPDHGFFRMVLEGVNTRSVVRGGTRIGDGIRTALSAFGKGPGSRLILLVTDGEDHDSFPLDAADEARRAGVPIVAIGFGDERGSEITITDPQTGARSFLTDRDGQLVRSRLDGKTLREIALRTGGAYVPAGVAALDLDSIVKAHIRPLLQEARTASVRTVPREHYPWLLLAALGLLLGAAYVGTGARSLVIVAALMLGLPDRAQADQDELGPPRRAYNQARASFQSGDLAAAERGFLSARDRAGSDQVLRHHAAFNLGLVQARKADSLQKDKPEEALAALHQAAAWFRDAIRTEESASLPGRRGDARFNLEVVLRRIQRLADQLNREQNRLEARLSRVLQDQRTLRDRLRGVLARMAQAGGGGEPLGLQRELEDQATFQRTLMSEVGALLDLAGDERAGIERRPEAQRSKEERGRLVQLQNLEHYLGLARDTMADASRLLRRLQPERGHGRVDQAIVELKRALEQLIDPVAVLKGLVADQLQARLETQALAQLRREALRLPAQSEEKPAAGPVPPWLRPDPLAQQQRGLASRTLELHGRLAAGVEHAAQTPPPQPATGQDGGRNQRLERLLAAAREATPHLREAAQAMEAAATALLAEGLPAADREQERALVALAQALSRFAGLRDLIEAAHAEQELMVGLLSPDRKQPQPDELRQLSTRQRLELVRQGHGRNVDRLARLQRLLEEEQAALAAGAQGGDGGQASGQKTDAEAVAGQQARLQEAQQHRARAAAALARMGPMLSRPGPSLLPPAEEALRELAELRRLFFSIVEHIKELHRDQTETADRTSSAQAERDEAIRRQRLGPLAQAQAGHGDKARAIAEALAAQADQAQGTREGQTEREAAGRLAEAAQQVRQGQEAMEAAARMLREDSQASLSPDLEPVLGKQRQALHHLEEALRLLEPPPKRPQEPDSQDQQVSQEQAARRLQAIREREAEQRRRQDRRQTQPEPVDKDW